MSADNGIYILKTPCKPEILDRSLHEYDPEDIYYEYRVRHLQAIENLYFDESAPSPPRNYHRSLHEYDPEDKQHVEYQEMYANRYNSKKLEVQIKNARRMWKDTPCCYSQINALGEAQRIYNEIMSSEMPIVEYGIRIIHIHVPF